MTERARSSLWDRTVEWFSARNLIIGAIVAGSAPLLGALLPETSGWRRVGVTAAAMLVALLGFAIPAAKSRMAERRAEEAEADAQSAGITMRMAISDTLLPALSHVVSGVDPRSPEGCDEVVAEAVALVLASAARLCETDGRSRARACWYQAKLIDDQPTFTPVRHFGRGVRPSTSFSARESRGVTLARLLIQDKTELWTDLRETRPPDWKPTGNDTTYQTFMVVPVRTSSQAFGLLMVDADQAGSLTEADVFVVQVLGWVLALALSQRAAPAIPAGTAVRDERNLAPHG